VSLPDANSVSTDPSAKSSVSSDPKGGGGGGLSQGSLAAGGPPRASQSDIEKVPICTDMIYVCFDVMERYCDTLAHLWPHQCVH
jgi:hypothetical protein